MPAILPADIQAPLLEVEKLRVTFPTEQGFSMVVRDLDFRLEAGRTLGLVGESGSGKSVTALALMGLVPPPGHATHGRIRLGGVDLLGAPEKALQKIRGQRMAMIFQEPMTSLNPVMTVGEQIAEVFRLHRKLDKANSRAAAINAMSRVGIEAAYRRCGDFPHHFSGGQRQRLMIAMAVAARPDLLIADEPTTALDVTVQAQILALLKELQAETGMAMIFISHDLAVVAEVADEILVMRDGARVEHGPAQRVLREPEADYTKTLLASRPRIGSHGEKSRQAATPPLLIIKDVIFRYRGTRNPAVDLTDTGPLTVAAGETLALVGESGSGKTTLARLAAGLYRPDSGDISFAGTPIGQDRKAARRYGREVQMVFQDPYGSLDPRMNIGALVAEPLDIHRIGSRQTRRARVAEVLAQVGLTPEMTDRFPHEFSGGQRQRIAIARALAIGPRLVICDEAVSALDVTVQAQILSLLIRLRETYGLAYLFITHDLAVVDRIAHRVAVMKDGRIVEQAPKDTLFSSPAHAYTRRLLGAVPRLAIAEDPA